MSERKVVHEVKLQKSVVIILGVIAAGIFFNAFGIAAGLKPALADIPSKIVLYHKFDNVLRLE